MPRFQYKNYLLLLLTVVAVFNYLDRIVLSMAIELIKADFQLSDSQLGFLSGFAFALFYAVAGLPLARWADRGNRNTIITLTTALWSGMVAISALVANFSQLLLVRIGVAVGEAGCLPPAQSLIAEYFDRSERPRAMSIYWLAGSLAVVIGYLGGGWLIEHYGWRVTFMAIGLPGIVLSILVKFTLREPRLSSVSTEEAINLPLKSVLATLLKCITFRHILFAFAVSNFFSLGLVVWLPTFFIRSYGMDIDQLGAWFALVWGVSGLVGSYGGGWLMVRYAAKNEPLQMRFCAIAFTLAGVFYTLGFLAFDRVQALVCMALAGLIIPMTNGAVYSGIQSVVGNRMRSVSLALILFVANLVGTGLGPLLVGVVSDSLADAYNQESLRYALAAISPGFIWVAFYYWRAGETIQADISAVDEGEGRVQVSSEASIKSADQNTSELKPVTK